MIQVFKLIKAEQGEGGYDNSLPELFKQTQIGNEGTVQTRRSKDKNNLPIVRSEKSIRQHNFNACLHPVKIVPKNANYPIQPIDPM